MHDSNNGFQDFVADNFTPLAILIDDKGNVKKINEAGLLFFDQSKKHINDIFSKVFLDVFESIFGECRKYQETLRVPVFYNFNQPTKKQFSVTITPFTENTSEELYLLVFQVIMGNMRFTVASYDVKPIESKSELKEFIDELQAANEEIKASNEELTTLNEELSTYKNMLEQMVQERTFELERQRTQFKNIINNLPGAVLKYRIDADGKDRLVFLSDQAEDLWEIPKEDALNNINLHWEIAFEEDIPQMRQQLMESASNMTKWNSQWRIKTKSGKIKWLEGLAIPEKKEDGAIEWDTIILDITQRKIVENSLKAQKALLEQTESIAKVGSWEWDVAKDQVIWSKEIFNIFDLDEKNGAPRFKNHGKLFSESSFKKLTKCVEDAIEHTKPFEVELEAITSKGDIKYCIARGSVRKNKYENVSQLFGSFQDITHRKKAEIKWKESQEDYKAMADSMPGVVLKYQLNPDFSEKLLYLSKGAEELHEIPHQEALDNFSLVRERLHPEDLSSFSDSIKKSAEDLSLWKKEYRILLPNGKIKWAEGRGMPKKMPDGSVIWNSIIMDISDKVKITQELREINDQLDLAIETAKLGVWVYDTQAEEGKWNDVLYDIFGISKEEFASNNNIWEDLLCPEDRERVIKVFNKISQGERISSYQYAIIRPDGEKRYILASGGPFKQSKDANKLVGINIDVTQIKLYEQELIKAKENAQKSEAKIREKNIALEKANTELDRFVYSVSHDLRAPIASAIGLSQIALNSTNLEEINHLNTLKVKTLNKLDHFIKDILDYSRNSRLEVKGEAVNWRETIDLILIEYHQAIQEKDIEIIVNIEGEEAFYTDKLRINIILNNLFSNAFKFLKDYTSEHKIEILVNSNTTFAEIKVSDNGIGIEAERVDKVFDMFYRANDLKPGSGIGLYILKESLNKLNGEINLQSKVGTGTSFFLKIPALETIN
ncbi:PAS domain-containing sensor histidine kinase [Chondrinema litorale]|uniref:PAS domain-containing sensor histidine kinase n=1 Tax=Chondrinema litorale TaxID=2994555 RepID=UPI002543A603|nr:PAS domain-containing sensor histidine kinase [Chondrinema litorale]UZR99502.1 PAS domain-containing sensor histidine kinase [Chondrinema litorale]